MSQINYPTEATIYPFAGGPSAVLPTNSPQGGTVANVAADGSVAVTVTFPAAYASVVSAVTLTPDTGSSDDGYQLSARAFNITLTGFEAIVSGGPSGSTCSLGWQAIGT